MAATRETLTWFTNSSPRSQRPRPAAKGPPNSQPRKKDKTDQEKHDAPLGTLENDWKKQQAGAPHLRLSIHRAYLKVADTADQSSLFSSSVALPWEQSPESIVNEDLVMKSRADGQLYKMHFEEHAQEIFSRSQHHWHALED